MNFETEPFVSCLIKKIFVRIIETEISVFISDKHQEQCTNTKKKRRGYSLLIYESLLLKKFLSDSIFYQL